jgi:pimeloyl-ACP methyl ester carboxylesterase
MIPGERRGYLDGPCGQIHYREQGEGIPLVLIHQAPWGSVAYRRAIPLLAGQAGRVIALDLPGHGMSSPPEGDPSIEIYAETVAALIDGLDLESVALIGHRAGGLVAARTAAEFSTKVSALLTDNMPFYSAERVSRVASLDEVRDIKPDGSHFTDRWALMRRIGDPNWSDETVHVGLVTYFANGPWKDHGHRAAVAYDLGPDLDRIACPTLVMSSRSDPLFAMGQLLIAQRPDWSYAELPGGAGMVFERTAEWAQPILQFLAIWFGSNNNTPEYSFHPGD